MKDGNAEENSLKINPDDYYWLTLNHEQLLARYIGV